jgi:hypothetical protein
MDKNGQVIINIILPVYRNSITSHRQAPHHLGIDWCMDINKHISPFMKTVVAIELCTNFAQI